jgi:predicted phosphoadenosine phosphosulfate sulfurtransferase
MFSGGKDSQVTLHLMREEYQRRGWEQPVDVIFLDEELLPDPVIDTVLEYAAEPWVKMHWFAVPMRNSKYVLGVNESIITMDPKRKLVREPPDFAIRLKKGDPRVFTQQDMDGFTSETLGFQGVIGYVLGIRASESLTRFRSVVNKLHENYICAGASKNVKLCKPIYDWSEDDVFKWLHDEGVPFCPQYRALHLAKHPMRISTPLHGEAARKMKKTREADPEFFNRMRAVFPDIDAQARYLDDFDKNAIKEQFGDGLDGCWRYISEHIKDAKRNRQAQKLFFTYSRLHEEQPEAYPTKSLLTALVAGITHRMVLPTGMSKANEKAAN